MNLTDKDRKLLWAKAGNRCSYHFKGEICGQSLVVAAGGEDVVVGQECHIIGDRPGSARYSPDCPNRDSYDNAILFCPIHHKMVDDIQTTHTVSALEEMKREHEAAVRAGRGGPTERLVFTHSEFNTEVSDADRAVGMEVNKPASFTNVKSTLKATNVKEAIGFTTNQPLTGEISSCPHCGGLVPFAYTGSAPSGDVRCPHCGRNVPVK